MKKIILLCVFLLSCGVLAHQGMPTASAQEFDEFPMDLPHPDFPPEELDAQKQDNTDEERRVVSEVRTDKSNVYLDFRDADIREVARIISKISGVSILVSEDVSARITVNIEGVSWKEALELILKTYNLAYIEKENFIIIVTYQKIREEEDKAPLTTKLLTLNFVNISEAKGYISSMMSKRGILGFDPRTNSLLITDLPDNIEKIEKILTRLDVKTPQVLIEVLMVDKKCTDDFDFGVDWAVADIFAGDYGTDDLTEKSNLIRTVSQMLSLTTASSFGVSYGNIVFHKVWLESLIEMWQQNQLADIIASPKILTIDNVKAQINILEQVPYTSETTSATGGTSTSTQFKDIGVKLNVTPHITPDGHVIMEIDTEQSFLVGFVGAGDEPQIDSRQSKTTMMVRDGDTIVIGGMRSKQKTRIVTKVPILGDIPILGKMFSRIVDDDTARELLIFVTPTVVKEPLQLTDEYEKARLSRQIAMREKLLEKTAKSVLPRMDEEEILRDAQSKLGKPIKALPAKPAKKPKGWAEQEGELKKQMERILPTFNDLELLPLREPNETY
ncbi:MAG: secretin and TonB N-terminal domain-containing protein [Candidatus Omnitrophota bacterium]|nr:MAG: secretin and TonB N-terminal domain-containing protein [Candidatus Omnitrophota bacterium]